MESSEPVAVDRLLAPLTNPGKIFGSGVNYASHGDEEPGFVFPDEKVIVGFIKLASSIVGPGAEIVIPPNDDVIRRVPGDTAGPLREHGFAVDYEVELGVILGTRARNVGAEDALHRVRLHRDQRRGVSLRAVPQRASRPRQELHDTFCPMGPCIVTRDELPDWEAIRIQSHVNGELRQDALVGEQLGPRPPIEWLSSVITLEPGDVLSTGTPAGCPGRSWIRRGSCSPATRSPCRRAGSASSGDRAGHGADSRVTDVR